MGLGAGESRFCGTLENLVGAAEPLVIVGIGALISKFVGVSEGPTISLGVDGQEVVPIFSLGSLEVRELVGDSLAYCTGNNRGRLLGLFEGLELILVGSDEPLGAKEVGRGVARAFGKLEETRLG